MQQIQLPDLFAPLRVFVDSMNQGQEQMQQKFILCQSELRDSIEGILEKDEAIQELSRKSEEMGAEISAVLFVDEGGDVVEEIFVDSIGDLTSVELDLVRIPPSGSGLTAWSIHTHPRYQNINFSPADEQVARARIWERGHCVISEIGGVPQASCMEL